jgi:hypothetical protein
MRHAQLRVSIRGNAFDAISLEGRTDLRPISFELLSVDDHLTQIKKSKQTYLAIEIYESSMMPRFKAIVTA